MLLIVGWKSSLIAQQNALVHQDFAVVNWSNQAGPPALLFKAGSKQWIEEFNIDLRFLNKDTSFQYGNLFQTSSGMDGIRIEMHPQGRLVLITGSGNIVTIADQFTANEFHKLQLRFKRGVSFEVGIDGKPPVIITDPNMIEAKLRMSNFTLGSGYGLARTLYGEIDGFKSDVILKGYSKLALFAYYIYFVSLFCIGVIAIMLLEGPNNIKPEEKKRSITQFLKLSPPKDKFDFSLLLGGTLILILGGVSILQFADPRYFGLAKWIPFLSAPIFVVGFIVQYGLTKKIGFSNHVLELFSKFIAVAYSLVLLILYLFGESRQDLIIFFFIFSAVLFGYFSGGGLNSICGAAVSWICLSSLLNWQVILGVMERYPLSGLLIGMGIILGLKKFIDELSTAGKPSKYSWLLLPFVVLVIILLSIRSDSLFIYGAGYHWEYFVGPIRALRDGGHLLYDVPSQYGFLNILLASKIPVASSWQALYIFQASLLIVVSCALIFSLWSRGQVFWARFALVVAVLLTLFYADPEWIGPQPFPSSSAVRFIWCYLILSASLFWANARLFNWVVAFLWCVGALWSAESSFYITAIYGFMLLAIVMGRTGIQEKTRALVHYLIPAVALLTVSISLIWATYSFAYGITPDFKLYFEYVLGYAAGHGYVPFDLTGPGNFLFILFIALGFIFISLFKKEKIEQNLLIPIAGASGCVWIVSSYYLGRPMPQNVSAMMPLYIVCGLIGIWVAGQARLYQGRAILAAVLSPALIIVMSPLFMQSWWEKGSQYSGYVSEISNQLPKASSELVEVIEKLNPNAQIPMVFYGNAAALPKLPKKYDLISDVTWAPVPLQLVQVPIKPERRDEILTRFMSRKSFPEVILIHEEGAENQSVADFLSVVNKFYKLRDITTIQGFEVFNFQIDDSLSATNRKP